MGQRWKEKYKQRQRQRQRRQTSEGIGVFSNTAFSVLNNSSNLAVESPVLHAASNLGLKGIKVLKIHDLPVCTIFIHVKSRLLIIQNPVQAHPPALWLGSVCRYRPCKCASLATGNATASVMPNCCRPPPRAQHLSGARRSRTGKTVISIRGKKTKANLQQIPQSPYHPCP